MSSSSLLALHSPSLSVDAVAAIASTLSATVTASWTEEVVAGASAPYDAAIVHLDSSSTDVTVPAALSFKHLKPGGKLTVTFSVRCGDTPSSRARRDCTTLAVE